MSCPNLTSLISSKSSLQGTKSLNCYPKSSLSIRCGLRELRNRINTVKNTQKITEAMKLVAAARVRRAQEAVVNGRPFSEALIDVLYSINEQLQLEDVDVPLTIVRPVTKVALIVITGDRGLCGSFNNGVIRKAEARIEELRSIGLDFTVISVGKKGNSYFSKRSDVFVDRFIEIGNFPTTKEAQLIADDVYSLFITEEVDKVELLYTKFVSLIKSDPVIHTLLPLSAKGEVCDSNGKCVDASEDEFFRLTTKEGKLAVERDSVRVKKDGLLPNMEFEQDPVQILDALMPLYLNNQILRALQESVASELSARMNAMRSATDNAVELKKTLSNSYNRERQAKITDAVVGFEKPKPPSLVNLCLGVVGKHFEDIIEDLGDIASTFPPDIKMAMAAIARRRRLLTDDVIIALAVSSWKILDISDSDVSDSGLSKLVENVHICELLI